MRELVDYIKSSLALVYSKQEISSFSKIILEHIFNRRFSPLLFDLTDITNEQKKEVEKIVNRLQKEEPIQYILGETEFYSLPFYVNQDVLIPRPETEELVELILNNTDKTKAVNILDIGTGSGAIAIALAKNLPNAHVDAWDISASALHIAKRNAERNNINISFAEVDVLNDVPLTKKYDIIVSNPPYVLEEEKDLMEKNVLDYEPHLALFVPNHDPLRFYNRIAELATNLLSPNGMLYYEINRAKGEDTQKMLNDLGFQEIEIIKDIFGNDRMTKAIYNP